MLWLQLIKLSFQLHLTYRAAAIAGLITNIFFAVIRIAILLALYGEQEVVMGMDRREALSYTVLSQALIMYLSLFSWTDVMKSIHSGEIAMHLLKPVSLFSYWFAQDIGRALAALLLRGLSLLLICSFFYDLTLPTSLTQLGLFFLALTLSGVVSFCYRFLSNLAAFWTANARGIIRFTTVLSFLCSGFLMPLRLFPEWLQSIIYLTPFPYMMDSCIEIYLGLLSGGEIARAFLNQLIWIALLLVANQLVLRRGLRKLGVLGG